MLTNKPNVEMFCGLKKAANEVISKKSQMEETLKYNQPLSWFMEYLSFHESEGSFVAAKPSTNITAFLRICRKRMDMKYTSFCQMQIAYNNREVHQFTP